MAAARWATKREQKDVREGARGWATILDLTIAEDAFERIRPLLRLLTRKAPKGKTTLVLAWDDTCLVSKWE